MKPSQEHEPSLCFTKAGKARTKESTLGPICGPCVMFFISRTQMLYSVILTNAEEDWGIESTVDRFPMVNWRAMITVKTCPSPRPGETAKPFFRFLPLKTVYMVKAMWLDIFQQILRKWHVCYLHVFAHETTLICFVKHVLLQKSEEENHIAKHSVKHLSVCSRQL